jgi:hypothetical protein
MHIAGFLAFVAGIVIAVSAGAKLPPSAYASGGASFSDSRFPDTVGVFVAGIVVSGVGLASWWIGTNRERQSVRSGTSAAGNDPLKLLRELQPPLQEFAGSIDSIEAADIRSRIDSLMTHHIEPFVDARRILTDRLGMVRGSEVLFPCAYAERMLNRAWSAASDGYLDEARTSVRDAVAAFEEAARIADAAAGSPA